MDRKPPHGTHRLRCPACQSTQVHVIPPSGEWFLIVCLSCYKKWAVAVDVSPDPSDAA